MTTRRVFIGPEELLKEPRVACDADVWRALLGEADLYVPVTSPVIPWVRNIAAARQWRVEILESVSDKLARSYPQLRPYLGELLVGREESASEDVWVFAGNRLSGLPHEAKASVAHAEAIARWRACAALSPAEQELLRTACQHFAPPDLQESYTYSATADPRQVMASMAGVQHWSFTEEWSPEQEPMVAERLAGWTRGKLAESGISVLSQALTSKASFASKSVIASAYAQAIAAGLEPEAALLSLLKPYLSGSDLQVVMAAVRPTAPEVPPIEIEKLADWFERSYLPYRSWMHARSIRTDDFVEPIWSAYEDVYLKALQKGLGSGGGPLAMHYSRALQNDSDRTLLVILDGMLPGDADFLVRQLRRLAPDWSVGDRKWLLTAAPTITEICRPSMVLGIAAAQIDDQDGAHTALSKAMAPLEEGQKLVVVKLRQPDGAYETLGAKPESLPKLAQAQLSLIADDLSTLMKSVALARVVLTADHGRCLGPVEPVVSPCKGKVHRRAITAVPRTEFEIDERSRRLDGDLLGFDGNADAVVARGATTFVGNGYVWYPHGGLLPEETFVPWLVLAKVAATIDVDGQLTISGISGREGRVLLRLANRSSVPVTMTALNWDVDGIAFSEEPEHVRIAPGSTVSHEMPLERTGKRYSEKATVLLTTPDGESHAVELPLRVEIRQMQTQNIDLLDDL